MQKENCGLQPKTVNLADSNFTVRHLLENMLSTSYVMRNLVIIEDDGGQHMEKSEADAERTTWLELQGFRVIRFWNDQVIKKPMVFERDIAGTEPEELKKR